MCAVGPCPADPGCVCVQVRVAAPWLGALQGSCAVVGEAVLVCADTAARSLRVCALDTEQDMRNLPLQVRAAAGAALQCLALLLCFQSVGELGSVWRWGIVIYDLREGWESFLSVIPSGLMLCSSGASAFPAAALSPDSGNL